MLGGTSLAAFMLPLKLAVLDFDIIPQPARAAVATPATRAMRKVVPYRVMGSFSIWFASDQHRKHRRAALSAINPTCDAMASSTPP
jgi:hypothetical protein